MDDDLHGTQRRRYSAASCQSRPRPTGPRVTLWATYYGPHSPLDGIARAVLAALHLAAQPWAADLRPERDRHAHRHAHRHALELRHLHGSAWSVTELADFAGLSRRKVRRALEQLRDLGELEGDLDDPGAVLVLPRYWLDQESDSAARQRTRRARARARDSHAQTERDGHAQAPRDSHALARARSQNSQREETATSATPATSSPLSDQATRARARDHAPLPPHPLDHEPLEPSSPEHLAYLWLNAIVHTATGRTAPYCAGKWRESYRIIGLAPELERARAADVLRARLRATPGDVRFVTPKHVADYWPGYAAGELPGSASARAPAPDPAAELERMRLDAAATAARWKLDAS